MTKLRMTTCLLTGLLVLLGAINRGVAADAAAALKNRTGGKTFVIIHSDDAGMSHSVNRGTFEGMDQGIVSSASIMVPCPWFSEFADYARKNPDGDYGIHLTLTSEWDHYRWGPVAPRESVRSLVDPEGYLWDDTHLVAKYAIASEAETELRAQIKRAQQFGVPLSHLDTHMGSVLVRPDLLEVYMRLGLEFNLPVMYTVEAADPKWAKPWPGLADGKGGEVLNVLHESRMPILDTIFQFYVGGEQKKREQVYLDYLRKLPPGYHQIIIHCGVKDDELLGITSSAPLRDSDRLVFTDPKIIKEVERMGIEVIGWKKFRELEDARQSNAAK